MYKNCNSNISYEMSNVTALTYLNFKKFFEEMSPTEGDMYMPKTENPDFLRPLYLALYIKFLH